MRRSIIKCIYAVIVFLIALVLMDHIMNKGNTDITMEMSAATFPTVHIVQNDRKINTLHGYVDKMDTVFQNETVTVLDAADRKLHLLVKAYGNDISKLQIEVRSLDGERLIESSEIEDYIKRDDTVDAQIVLKDLLNKNEEHELCINLTDLSGHNLYYYTRIIISEYADQVQNEIEFAMDFSNRTFDKESAKELTKYLESNSDGDNTTYSKVNIHSSFSQITWGSLRVKRETEPEIFVKRSNPYVGNIELHYIVSVNTGIDTEYYNVTEYFYIRYGKERMYLLDYERTMDSIFVHENSIFTNNKISLGITDPDIQLEESEDGNIFAFVKEGRLYSMNLTDNKLALLFGFYDENNLDERTLYQNMKIRIISVDETGNIRFLVYGYMNRGNHEGSVGVCCYYYNSMLNTIEEEIFIPSTKTAELLAQDVDKLAYVNNNSQLFMILYGCVYRIDLTQKSSEIIVENLTASGYQVSESGRMLVWQNGEDSDACTQLTLMNLNTGYETTIEAGRGRYIKPLGFMNEDVIYGVCYSQDVTKDNLGMTVFPMYQIRIQDERGNILKNYEKSGIYVTQAQVTDNQISLKRVRAAGESGTYVQTDDDQIMNDASEGKKKNQIEVVATQDFEKIVQIAAKTNFKVTNLKYLTPKQVMYEGERSLRIADTDDAYGYYVYDKYGVLSVCNKANDAILLADENKGCVRDETGRYIWEKSSKNQTNQIMWFSEDTMDPEKGSLANCLDNMILFEGQSRDSQRLMQSGKSILSILQENLENKKILDLSGCSLNSVLYYVSREKPVLALLNDGNAVLVVGYNELNTVIYNPTSHTVSKMGMNDSEDYFEANGNHFITYIEQ